MLSDSPSYFIGVRNNVFIFSLTTLFLLSFLLFIIMYILIQTKADGVVGEI